MNQPTGDSTSIQSVRRAVDVLFTFDVDAPTLSPADVAARTGMNRTTAWRYMVTLAEKGLLRVTDEEAGRFALGAGLLTLAELFMRQWGDLTAIAQPTLVALRDQTGETAALHLRDGWSRIVVTQVESRHDVRRTYTDLGEPIPLHLGAPSIAICAGLDPSELQRYLTGADIAGALDRDHIEDELRRCREQGFAVSVGTRTPGSASLAAPITGSDGRTIASVGISGPSTRVLEIGFDALAPSVVDAASAISAHLSGRAQTDQNTARPSRSRA